MSASSAGGLFLVARLEPLINNSDFSAASLAGRLVAESLTPLSPYMRLHRQERAGTFPGWACLMIPYLEGTTT
jgi:hypothetical protein